MKPAVTVAYQTAKGAQCATDFPLGKAALECLAKINPRPLVFDALLEQAAAVLRDAGIATEDQSGARAKLAAFLLDLYSAGIVEFRTTDPGQPRAGTEHPTVSALTRWQSRHGQFVTSHYHVAVKIEDEVGRCLLGWLDGTHERTALREKLWQLLKSKGALNFQNDDEAGLRQKVAADLEKNLEKLAGLGLLVG